MNKLFLALTASMLLPIVHLNSQDGLRVLLIAVSVRDIDSTAACGKFTKNSG